MTSRTTWGIAVCSLLAAASSAQPPEPRRLAIVVANSNYRNLTRLEAPRHDVEVLRPALESTHFTVAVLENVTIGDMGAGLSSFLKSVGTGDQVLVFYSGYAVQSSGDDVLLPVEFDPASQAPLPTRGISLTRINEDLDDRKPSLRILLLDASRDDKRLAPVASGSGLVLTDVLTNQGTATISSAPLNQTIPEPPAGSPGALAKAFAELIPQPGSSMGEVIRGVQSKIRGAAGPPFSLNQLGQAFYFTAPPPPPPPPPPEKVIVTERVDLTTKIAQVHRLDRLEYKFIPKGTFLMGCVPSDRKQDQCEESEKPQHPVTLTKNFWIGVTDVTNDAYQRFANANKSRKMPEKPFWEKHGDYPDHPVVNVSWDDAQAYCGWVGGRLPTEAEWEYAARGGNANEVYPLNQENSRDKANFQGRKGNDIYDYTSPVKKFDSNPWGLYDMAGNVWQWAGDWFSADYYKNSPAEEPAGPASGKERVARGGSFRSDPAKHLRISFREKYAFPKGADFVGFRCAIEDSPAARSQFGAQ
jgi:hypothetical protein